MNLPIYIRFYIKISNISLCVSLSGPGSHASSDDPSVSSRPAVLGCCCCCTARLPLPTGHVLQARYTHTHPTPPTRTHMYTEQLPKTDYTLVSVKEMYVFWINIQPLPPPNKSSMTLLSTKKETAGLSLSLPLRHTHMHTNTGIPVYVNEVCQVRNVLGMSEEIYKPCLFTSGTIHWTQLGLECLFYGVLKTCQLHNTSATWNFTLSHTQTHTRSHAPTLKRVLLVLADPTMQHVSSQQTHMKHKGWCECCMFQPQQNT